MKEKKSNIGKYLLILVPFVMGVTGFTVLDGQPVVDSLFLSMEMYFLNYSDSPPNILIEIARWTAPLMTASGVLMSISKIRGRILQMLRYYRGDSIAVYGDDIISHRCNHELIRDAAHPVPGKDVLAQRRAERSHIAAVFSVNESHLSPYIFS